MPATRDVAVSTSPSFRSIWIIWPPIIRTCDARDLHAVDARQLRDHLKLDGPVGHQLEGGKRIGKDGAGRDPLEFLDDVFGPAIAFERELILGLSREEMGAKQQIARAQGFAFALDDPGDPVAQRGELGRLATRAGSRSIRPAACMRTVIGRGDAAPATMSSGGTRPRRRSFSLARIAALSASANRSVLLKMTIERLPWRTSAASGSNSVRVRSWSSTKISRSARAASSRASCSRAEPASPISERPGVSVRKTVALDAVELVGVMCGLLGRAHDRFDSCRLLGPEVR